MGFRRRRGGMMHGAPHFGTVRVAASPQYTLSSGVLPCLCTPHEIALLTHSSYTNRTERTVTIEQAPLTSYCGGVTKNYGYQPPSHILSTTLFMCSLRRTAFNFAPSFGENGGAMLA